MANDWLSNIQALRPAFVLAALGKPFANLLCLNPRDLRRGAGAGGVGRALVAHTSQLSSLLRAADRKSVV